MQWRYIIQMRYDIEVSWQWQLRMPLYVIRMYVTRQIQPNLSFGQVELTTWLSSIRYQYTRKFLYQQRKWLLGQPARKLSVDLCTTLAISHLDEIPPRHKSSGWIRVALCIILMRYQLESSDSCGLLTWLVLSSWFKVVSYVVEMIYCTNSQWAEWDITSSYCYSQSHL